MLAVAYSYSGYTKLLSPTWVEGETIRLVLENPLARDHALRGLVLALPPIMLQLLTWAVLWVEVLFAPLVLVRRLRPVMWTLMLIAQLGFLCFLNFADLTFPMLLVHLLTFDPRWLQRRAPQPRGLLLFDGDCAFCHATVRFATSEDHAGRLSFAPLSGSLAESLLAQQPLAAADDTIVFIHSRGRDVKARAVAGVLMHAADLVVARQAFAAHSCAYRECRIRLRRPDPLQTRWAYARTPAPCSPQVASLPNGESPASPDARRAAERGAKARVEMREVVESDFVGNLRDRRLRRVQARRGCRQASIDDVLIRRLARHRAKTLGEAEAIHARDGSERIERTRLVEMRVDVANGVEHAADVHIRGSVRAETSGSA